MPRLVAFFLPQFHAIPENDEWWGAGFTEWTNTRRAKPLFHGHHQPRVPADEHYFDLTDPAELSRQSDEATAHGIDAFCFYFYWFNGTRLLESPLDIYTELDDVAPFCVSWANENWTRRWDGKDSELLMGQSYSPSTASDVYADLRRYLLHPNYVRLDGRPVLVIHRVTDLPDPAATAARWRELAALDGLPGLHLVAAETTRGIDPREVGFDAVVEFPPVGLNTISNAMRRAPRGLARSFAGRLLSYERLARSAERRPTPGFTRHRGVMPGWDNTARRGLRGTIYIGESPSRYARWLATSLLDERRLRAERGLVFVNAWNEWAEGAYLQPDQTHGTAYLRATQSAVDAARAGTLPSPVTTQPPPLRLRALPGFGMARSVAGAAGSSVLAAARRLRLRRLRSESR